MLHILARRHQALLAQFASSKVLVAFDYDGTLAPLVSEPSRACMRAATRRLLRIVAERYPCVVISGRARADVSARVEGIPLRHVAGNHGVEPWGETARFASRVRRWMRPLERRLATQAGVVIENKTYSITLHYRLSPHKGRALQAITEAVRLLPGVRTVPGKYSMNLVPSGAPHKGVALERVRALLACERAIFVGDDNTDEDAFGALPRDVLLGIRIGGLRDSRASHMLRAQREVDMLLRALVTLRPGART